jgi:hypothetical protein
LRRPSSQSDIDAHSFEAARPANSVRRKKKHSIAAGMGTNGQGASPWPVAETVMTPITPPKRNKVTPPSQIAEKTGTNVIGPIVPLKALPVSVGATPPTNIKRQEFRLPECLVNRTEAPLIFPLNGVPPEIPPNETTGMGATFSRRTARALSGASEL